MNYRDVRIAGASFRVGGGEDGVDEHKSADDFSSERRPLVVAGGDGVRAAPE